MSDVVEKTLAALPKILGDNLLGGVVQGPYVHKNLQGLGPCYQNFVRLLHKTKTKYEEEQFIKTQLKEIAEQLNSTDTSQDRAKDFLFQCVYCRMLGYNVDFCKINCLKLMASSDVTGTKIGFTATNLLLERKDDRSLLATSTIVKDLSGNILEIFNAIPTAAHLTMPCMIEIILPYVQKITKHPRELVRAKAVMCLNLYLQYMPELLKYEQDSFFKSLCDPDPSVISAACDIFNQLIKRERRKYSTLVPILVNILQQIIQRKFPSSFEYHNIQSPWLQIRILKMLALLGRENQRDSQIIYPVLQVMFESIGSMKNRMAFAISYECINTCTSIYPNQHLLKTASQSVGNFLRSKDTSLKYVGIKALTRLVKVNQEYALQYQAMVVELLDNSDETIKRKTLLLLYNMTNEVNVQPVCDKLLQHMVNSNDRFHKEDLLYKIIELIHKFFKPEIWFIDCLFKVLQICPSNSLTLVMDKVISTLKKSTGIPKHTEFCQHLIKTSVECLFRIDLHGDVTKLSSWAIGQHYELLENMPKDKLMAMFTRQLSQQHIDEKTKLWLLSALVKLIQSNILTNNVIVDPVEQLTKSESNILVQEKLQEVVRISQIKHQKSEAKNIKMDFTLSFLDKYVWESLISGGCPYKPKHMRRKQTQHEKGVIEIFKGIQNEDKDHQILSGRQGDEVTSSDDTSLATSDSGSKLPSAKKVWGREGRVDTSNTTNKEESQISEQDKNRQELISALFSGITVGESGKTDDSVQDAFFTEDFVCAIQEMNSSSKDDTGGWRQLHHSDTNSVKLSLEDVSVKNSETIASLLSQDNTGDQYSHQQIDSNSLGKNAYADVSTPAGEEDNSNLYDNCLDDDIMQSTESQRLM